jgi:hypothetical protein
MVDVPAIQGPILPPEPPGKKSERSVDSDTFHKEMHKRVEKVSETDQEQKKKRKRKEEAEEEEEPTAAGQGPTTPPDQVTPFSLVEGKKKASPLDMQKGPGISPLASAQPTTTPGAPPPIAPFLAAPSSEEIEDDSGMLEEPSFMETMPTDEAPLTSSSELAAPPPPSYPLEEAPPSTTSPPSSKETPPPPVSKETPPPKELPTPSAKEGKPSTPSDEKKKTTVQAGPPSTPSPKKGVPTPPVRPQAAPITEEEEGEILPLTPEEMEEQGITAPEIEAMKEEESAETTGFFEQFLEEKEKGTKKEIKPKETPEEIEELAGGVAPVTPLPPSAYIEKEKKEEEEIAALGLGGAPSGLELPPPPLEITPAGPTNPYTNLHPQVMELFDRMVGTMTVMSLSGITETVVTLDAPKFASSVFYGSQFIIQEYSSAPQAYNIQLNAGSPQALSLFQGNADDLMAAFQYGNYNFRVNRLETGLLTKPLVRRKEPPSGGGEGKKGSER